jgi:phosphotriesterase-related protein
VHESSYLIRTAYGPKEFRASAGAVLPHEHIVIDSRVWWEGQGDWRQFDDEDALRAATPEALAEYPQATIRENMLLSDWFLSAKELRAARDAGTQLVVDLTVLGSGPDTRSALRAADTAEMDVVVSVGRYLHDAVPVSEHEVGEDELVERWMRQIADGVDGYLPGIIGEIGTSAVIEDDEWVSLRAAARTQARTGLPMNIHVHPYARQAVNAVTIAANAGADLGKLAVSHLDCDLNIEELRTLLALGVYVEFDNFGTSRHRKVDGRGYPDDAERLDMIEELIDLGHQSHILLSHDINHRNSLRANGGWGYAHIAEHIVPQLTERFGERIARELTAENPLRFLELPNQQNNPGE